MPISKKVIETHGGTLCIQSTLEIGTVAEISLPYR